MSYEFWTPQVVIVWGCHAGYQYERDWLLHLLRPRWIKEVDWTDPDALADFKMPPQSLIILVESARYLLEAEIRSIDIESFRRRRLQRFTELLKAPKLIVWHISDEEGIDGDDWYPSLPKNIRVFREFPHERFDAFPQIDNLPLGPTRWGLINVPWVPASKRKYPWSFMGTLWPKTTRSKALKIFQDQIPEGFTYGGLKFGQGLPIDSYLPVLLQSTFSLCPEGNRHSETFRFYESLQLGCIPITLENTYAHKKLFNEDLPLPVFRSWEDAVNFVTQTMKEPILLDQLQLNVNQWWTNQKYYLSNIINELAEV